MTRLAHLSDLHFGRARPELLAPLATAIGEAKPDLVVVSGDLTQRARTREFTEARHFLDSLGARWMAVPGNHDIPLFRPVTRMTRPYRRYRECIALDLEPVVETQSMIVAGCNTSDPLVHQRGKVRAGSIRKICQVFEAAEDTKLRIVVAHHPFEQHAGADKTPMKRAGKGLDRLAECGTDVILSGHLHMWHTGAFVTRPDRAGPIQVHAGTSLSSRLRGEVNDFGLLDVTADQLTVTRMAVPKDGATFEVREVVEYLRTGDGLRRAETGQTNA